MINFFRLVFGWLIHSVGLLMLTATILAMFALGTPEYESQGPYGPPWQRQVTPEPINWDNPHEWADALLTFGVVGAWLALTAGCLVGGVRILPPDNRYRRSFWTLRETQSSF